jgi:hypothetical protein
MTSIAPVGLCCPRVWTRVAATSFIEEGVAEGVTRERNTGAAVTMAKQTILSHLTLAVLADCAVLCRPL